MKFLFLLSILSVFIFSCSKDDDQTPAPATIDVSCQQYVDNLGNPITSTGTCPPVIDMTFTALQIALFNSLDTVDLAGTVKPDFTGAPAVYPNPFHVDASFAVHQTFENNVPGQVVAEYILTDSLLNPVFKRATRFTFTVPGNSATVLLQTTGIPAGRYRLFYTFSAQGYNNFKRGWINLTALN